MSRESIFQELASEVNTPLDLSEGSVAYDLFMAMAMALDNKLNAYSTVMMQGFADSATGTYLDRICFGVGISRKLATYASGALTVTGEEGSTILKGTMFSNGKNEYISISDDTTIGETETAIIEIVCTTSGSAGNASVGTITIIPITISGITSVTNATSLSDGTDEESDDDLRDRLIMRVSSAPTSGNVSHYENWAMEISGVGGAKCIPVWSGNGTVKVVLLSESKTGTFSDSSVITAVDTYIKSVQPIGATLTTVAATNILINVSAVVTYEETANPTNTLNAIKANITEYLKSIAFTGKKVSYAKIGSAILDTEGVSDYIDLLINSDTGNITISSTSVAVLGAVTDA